MTHSSGTHLGPYEIVVLIGSGGMGEVYRARDARLGREVAIKVLRPELSRHPDRLRCFEQEARAAGALNHPNVLAVYDLGIHEGSPYIVSELLEGETLRARLAGSALPLRKGLDYAQQIAKGLAAAHQKGIAHRDLKPENIFITTDGRVKILDFGLAKLTEPSLSGESEHSTPTASGTEPGVVMGTVGYMSPEQVLGRPADHRSDIFSFGAILHEMLSGQRAFRRGSAVETMSAILKDEPPELSQIAPNLPPELDRVVRHCLEKSPEERFQSARDLAFDLESVPQEPGSRPPQVLAPLPSARRPWLAFVALVLLAALVFLAGRKTAPVALPPAPTFRQVTFRLGTASGARFAPDGQTIIYSAAWDGKPSELFTTRAGIPESRPLGFGPAGLLAVSSAGELAITSGCEYNWGDCTGTLARVPLSGGAPRQLLENVYFADWSSDGTSLAVVHVAGGRFRLEFPIGKVLYETTGWITHPRVSPKGDRIAFLDHPRIGSSGGSVAVVTLDGKKQTLSGEGRSALGLAWQPSGDEVWFTSSPSGAPYVLYGVTLSGRERVIFRAPGELYLQDISRDGRVLLARGNARTRMMFLPPAGRAARDISWFNWSTAADLSADGNLLLFYEWGSGVGRTPLVYLRKTDGSDAVRLGEGKALSLSPDGKWAAALEQTATPQLVLLPSGPGEQRRLPQGGLVEYYSAAWFPDGKRLLLVAEGKDRAPRSYVQDVQGGDPQPVTPEGVMAVLVSPDGQRLAAYGGDGESYLYPVDGGKPAPIRGIVSGDTLIQWSSDGRSIFVRARGEAPVRIFRVDLAGGRRSLWKELPPPEPVGNIGVAADQRGVLITPDGRSIVYTYWTFLTELFLAEGLR